MGSNVCETFFFWDDDLIFMKINKINYTYLGKSHNESILKERRIQKYLNPFKSFNFLRFLVKVVTTDIYLILCGLHRLFKTNGFVLMPHIFFFQCIPATPSSSSYQKLTCVINFLDSIREKNS